MHFSTASCCFHAGKHYARRHILWVNRDRIQFIRARRGSRLHVLKVYSLSENDCRGVVPSKSAGASCPANCYQSRSVAAHQPCEPITAQYMADHFTWRTPDGLSNKNIPPGRVRLKSPPGRLQLTTQAPAGLPSTGVFRLHRVRTLHLHLRL